MDFLDLKDISERYMELINPTSLEKMLTVGRYLRLKEGSRVIDFGCGYGETLALWGREFAIGGVGIDVRPKACERAREKTAAARLADRIEIVCARGADYAFEAHSFDAAVCIGATFVWGGYRETLRALTSAIRPGGRIAVGEPYWQTHTVPAAFAQQSTRIHSEPDLLNFTRQEGFELEYLVRASRDDWDRYEAENWHGLIRWLEENPAHPERRQVLDFLHSTQDEYFQFGRQYMGWATYVLAPAG